MDRVEFCIPGMEGKCVMHFWKEGDAQIAFDYLTSLGVQAWLVKITETRTDSASQKLQAL
jgi:hypothetical protein